MNKKQTDSPGRGRRERGEQLLELRTAALEAADNAILITDREATIVWVNSAFQQLTGDTKEEAMGQNMRLLKSGQQPASFYQQMWGTILSGQKWQGELVNRRKDGSLYRAQMTITPGARQKRGDHPGKCTGSFDDVFRVSSTCQQMTRD